jgi:hypothetical protein
VRLLPCPWRDEAYRWLLLPPTTPAPARAGERQGEAAGDCLRSLLLLLLLLSRRRRGTPLLLLRRLCCWGAGLGKLLPLPLARLGACCARSAPPPLPALLPLLVLLVLPLSLPLLLLLLPLPSLLVPLSLP